jgi:ATP-binding protein involved in chromosome partitioning
VSNSDGQGKRKTLKNQSARQLLPTTVSLAILIASYMQTQESILEALKAVKYPGYSRDIVSFGLVRGIAVNEGSASLKLQFTSNSSQAAEQVKAEVQKTVGALPGIQHVEVEITFQGNPQAAATPQNPWGGQSRLPGVRNIIAVASGKGGVGKSTVSVNLACALAHLGAKVGLLDCDIYGPSIPLMMGTQERPTVSDNNQLVPPEKFGVKLMSIGFLVEDDAPLIWRGPMIKKAIEQFLKETEWGALDYLIIDLPPGTGDAQLTVCQTVPLDGGIVVTTPQEASLSIVRKGIAMFEKVNVPILGIVENMSYFTDATGARVEIFGHGGGRTEADRKKIPFLGEIPIFLEIRAGGDQGKPVVTSNAAGAPSQAFLEIATKIRAIREA